jgi:acetyl esterase/lipase
MGYAFVSINYRLSGEAIFPAAALDCREAVRFLITEAGTYGLDPDRIGVIGESAGANLAAMLIMNIKNGSFYGEQTIQYPDCQPGIKAGVLWYCPTDFTKMDEQARENGVSLSTHDEANSPESCYVGAPVQEAPKAIMDAANPMTHISDEMAKVLIQHGKLDQLVPFAQSVIFTEALDRKGLTAKYRFLPLETADHVDPQFESDENMKIVWDFIRENI